MTQRHRSRRGQLALTAAITVALAVSAGVARATLGAPRDARIVFEAAGPAGLTIEGRTAELKVDDANGNVILDVPLGNLGTGIALRDRHMKEALEVQKYPDAVLTVQRSALRFPAAGATAQGDVPAVLRLHGQNRPVTVHYEATADADGFSAHGSIHVNTDDFGIVRPSYLGVTVKPDIDIRADFHLTGT